MTAAMLSAIEDRGDAIGLALAPSGEEDPGDPLLRYWQRVIGTLRTHRDLWLASIEAMIQGEHDPHLRDQIASGMEQGRSGLAAILTGQPEDGLDEETVRSAGSVAMALMSGVTVQWLVDPARAPSPEQVAAGIRALGKLQAVQAFMSRSRVSVSSCGSTLVCPITGMKLPSPPQRGTTCWCRCSAIPAPATDPWFMPRLNPCGLLAVRITRIARWVNSAASTVSAGVSSG